MNRIALYFRPPTGKLYDPAIIYRVIRFSHDRQAKVHSCSFDNTFLLLCMERSGYRVWFRVNIYASSTIVFYTFEQKHQAHRSDPQLTLRSFLCPRTLYCSAATILFRTCICNLLFVSHENGLPIFLLVFLVKQVVPFDTIAADSFLRVIQFSGLKERVIVDLPFLSQIIENTFACFEIFYIFTRSFRFESVLWSSFKYQIWRFYLLNM